MNQYLFKTNLLNPVSVHCRLLQSFPTHHRWTITSNLLILILTFFPFSILAQDGIHQTFESLKSSVVTSKVVKPFVLNTTTILSGNFFQDNYSPTFLDISPKVIQQIDSATPAITLTIPIKSDKSIDLELFAVNIFSPDFKVLNSDNREVRFSKGFYYHGRIKGNTHSIAAISIINGEVSGMVSDSTGNRTLKKQKNGNVYTFYYEHGLNTNNQKPFMCDTPESPGSKPLPEHTTQAIVGCKIVNIYIEADYPLFSQFGSSIAPTVNYMTDIFNQVAVLYRNENIAIQLSALKIWTTPDPYTGTNTATILPQFQNTVGPSFNGNLAQLFSGRNLGGGRAYIDVLCYKSAGFGVNQMTFGGYYDGGFTYSPVGEIAHEMGHNFGSNHTHWCGWSGGAIDNCGPSAGYSEGSCIPPAASFGSGTIMSYCHLLSGVQTYHSNGFGTQPGNLIRSRVSTCNQVAINYAVPSSPATQNVTATSAIVSWSIPATSTNFIIRYRRSGSETWLTATSTSNVKELTGLLSGIQYEWQVTGDCSNGNYTSLATFTTGVDAIITSNVGQSSLCPGEVTTVNYTKSGTINPGNSFTVQLSDLFGSFSSPLNLSSIQSTTSGSIIITLPSNISGNGYKIRVVSDSPAVESTPTTITIKSVPPAPIITYSPSNTICPGQTTALNVANCSGTVSWMPNGSGTDIYVNPTVSTTYSATCTENGCSSSPNSLIINVVLPTAPTISSFNCINDSTKVWNKRYGGNNADLPLAIISTADGGYLTGGTSTSDNSGDKSQPSQGGIDMWILKTDANGNKLWDRSFGGINDDGLADMIATNDGGYLLAGYSASPVSGDQSQSPRGGYDYWLIKIDANGNKLWDKRYGGNNDDLLSILYPAADGGYLLAGRSTSDISGDKTQASQGGFDYWIIKIDANGNKLWDRRFGGNGDDILSTIEPTADGTYLLAGHSGSGISGDKTQISQGGFDYWIVKIDISGNQLWDRCYGSSGDDEFREIVSVGDGNFILSGISASAISGDKTQASQGGYDIWLVKMDADGNKVWDKCVGGNGNDIVRSMITAGDGGFVLGGVSDSEISGDKTQASQGGYDYWILRMDINGNKVWDKRFGGSGIDQLRMLYFSNDDAYVLVGESDSGISGDKSQNSQGGKDYWIVKLAACRGSITICEGQSITLSASGCNGTVNWSNGMVGTTIIVDTPGTYTATCKPSGTDCVSSLSNYLVLTSALTSLNLIGNTFNGLYKANQTITSSQTIPPGNNVSYEASSSIYLQGTFQAQAGSVFKAEIKGCN